MIAIMVLAISFTGCVTQKIKLHEAGKMTLASTKNVNLKANHALLSKSAGFDESQVKGLEGKKTKRKTKKNIVENYEKLKGDNVEQAVNNVIESVPGGVYIENLEVYYTYEGLKDIFFIASGDVYGKKGKDERNIRGFYAGCKALYKNKIDGKVISLIDDQYCLWRETGERKFLFFKRGNHKPKKLLYDDLIKVDE